MKKAQRDIQRVGLRVEILIGMKRARDMKSNKLCQTLYLGTGSDHVEHEVHADARREPDSTEPR